MHKKQNKIILFLDMNHYNIYTTESKGAHGMCCLETLRSSFIIWPPVPTKN